MSAYANIYQLLDDRFLYIHIGLENKGFMPDCDIFDYNIKIIELTSDLDTAEINQLLGVVDT